MLIAAEQSLFPAYNITPGAYATVVLRDADAVGLAPVRWGLVPRWTKSLEALKAKPINARSETADSSPMFRDAFRSGRCLVPAIGFYEWQGAKPPKQPWFIHADDQEVLSFAGLWSQWKQPDGVALRTFAILTTDANEIVAPIHNRMPCILHPEEEAEWMDDATKPARCKELLRPYPADRTSAYPVSTAVNRPGTDGPELVQPLDGPSDLFPGS
jgi:putative SOS response-associated peptidase YedK